MNKRHDEQNKREGSAIADGIDFNGNFLNSIRVFIVKKICLFAEVMRLLKHIPGQIGLALFDTSISNIDCRYIDTFEEYRYRYQYGHFENIDMDIDIDKVILENIDITIDIDKAILKISISISISIGSL